ncbi:imm11 family protein [Hyalangium rubrum]|uniref:Immunity MXAN-0049 protein domain-containing protein n=1 Tax=Hyalangium rubrum TaxID=3103134 RepID=A0ABU5H521_9BACT|nr:DUF1629 domain-containing protein [Hyalangium sp. s54d21]MDY7228593.1 hypothetical protein [Hyalangium sp. s54d21]
MPKRYFDLFEDVHVPGRWYLDDPVDAQGREVDLWQFERGVPVDVEGRLRIPMDRPGEPLDFSVTPVGGAPVVHARVASLFTGLAPKDVQLVPVEVEGQAEEYFVLNVTRVVRCIDDKASAEVQYWKPEDGRPEKTGNYRAVHGMRINSSMVGDAKVFRPWGWLVVLLVSEEIKAALEGIRATGAKFKEV